MQSPPKTNNQRHRAEEILTFLPVLFRTADVEKLSPTPSLFLNRAARRKRVIRIMRGVYMNVWKCAIIGVKPSVEEVASFLRPPAYISCEWALNHHGVLDQFPSVCTVITLAAAVGKRNVVFLPEDRTSIEFSRIKPELFWGFERGPGEFSMATAEKAFLDIIYLRGHLPFRDELNIHLIDQRRLARMAAQFPAWVRAVAGIGDNA